MSKLPYFKPKTLIYTGKHIKEKTSIKHYQYNRDELIVYDEFMPNDQYKHYIQVRGLNDLDVLKKIQEYYHIEPLIMEDILNVNQRVKFEYKDDYIFGTLTNKYLEDNHVKSDYLSLYISKDTMITFHETTPVYLDTLITLINDYKEMKSKSIDLLFYYLLDMITDDYLDVQDYLETKMNAFEEEVLESKTFEQEAFYMVRKRMLKLHNIVSPMYEQVEKLITFEHHLLTEDSLHYFDDLRDHLKRLDQKLYQSRDMMRQLLDLHMNNQSTKMNKIMSTLTLFSAIFIPLSFLTGFFGMNFHYFEALDYPYAVLIFIVVCAVITGGMFLFFKKRRWF